MKKYRIILVSIIGLVIAAMAITVEVLDEDRMIPVDGLPTAVKTYVQNNYPNSNIAYAKKKNEIIKTTYKVGMSDGFELEFDGNGMLTDFDD
ncbi:MAG: PepSY-like domain-containing protein [Prevotella sp.]|nr:PepSY-like domain-containing protein [Prevotella sp.]